MLKSTIQLLFVLTTSVHVNCDDNVFMTIEEVPGPGSNTSIVGPPGPVGLVGLPGSKGTTGRIKTCKCDIKRIRRQKALLDEFKDNMFGNIQRMIFNFRQNPDSCSVGIKTGRIRDSAMTASSFRTAGSIRYWPYRGRLDMSISGIAGAAWVPQRGKDENWIQVELPQPTRVTGIVTQGLQYNNLFVSSFKISYSNKTEERTFIQDGQHDKIFIGNHDGPTYKINMFPEPITARYFRLYVVTFYRERLLRFELLTC